jgi:hypothetical protein
VKVNHFIKRFQIDISNEIKESLMVISLILTSFFISLWIFKESFQGISKNGIPLAGDGLLTGLYLKIVNQSTYLSLIFQNINSNSFGWPNQLNFSSYPVGNTFEMLGIKVFMDLTGIIDPSQIIHIFSILKAVPIAVAVYVFARLLGVSRLLSFCIGILFSFNTFNLIRAEGHFFLALTWSLPLGLAAIFVAFKQVYLGRSIKKKDIIYIIIMSFFSFMSGFYYSIFLIILSIISLIFLLILKIDLAKGQTVIYRVKKTLKSLMLPISVVFILVLGLIIQTLPVLIRNKAMLNLSGPGDRSPIESIIYAGTPESLFFELFSFGLRILNRPDLVAFLQSRISWEGSQIGALSGLVLAIILLLILISGVMKLMQIYPIWLKNKFKLDVATVFIFLTLMASLLFYFTSPLNFAVSYVFPQIRAWGRLSVIISLLTLILIGIIVTRIQKTTATVWIVTPILFFIPLVEINQFHINRPTSVELSQSEKSQNLKFETVLNELKYKFQENCSLVNLPIYPFPEFDVQNDQNIDYGQLQVPILDDGYFKWSYAGIKATRNFATWQPLISEFPPFSRASIEDQIKYAKSIGACGALIDRTYLIESENRDLNKIFTSKDFCISELAGTHDANPNQVSQNRYVLASFRGNECQFSIPKDLVKLATESTSGKFVWRIDQSSTMPYNGGWQVFPYSSTINARVRAQMDNERSTLVLRVRVVSTESMANSSLSICITHMNSGGVSCSDAESNLDGITEIKLPQELIYGKMEQFSVTLKNNSRIEISGWGIQVGLRN